jgi:hypothetical protein
VILTVAGTVDLSGLRDVDVQARERGYLRRHVRTFSVRYQVQSFRTEKVMGAGLNVRLPQVDTRCSASADCTEGGSRVGNTIGKLLKDVVDGAHCNCHGPREVVWCDQRTMSDDCTM